MYWPNQQSISLNLAVANLFIQTYHKFFINLNNRTKQYLTIDILDSSTKRCLLLNTLIELEIIILDIVELNLTTNNIKKLYPQILYDLINKTMNKFINSLEIESKVLNINLEYDYNKFFFEENRELIKTLFIYLIFGSTNIKENIFLFDQSKTPNNHVKILFENFIIQTSNIILLNLLEHKIYKIKNQSIRKITHFQNNLYSYYLTYFYLYHPQNIYCNQYKVWLLSSNGIIYKHIYANRYYDYLKLSTSQISAIIYLELQDFTIPKINFIITLTGKLIIYILIEIISKSFQLLLKQTIIRFSNYEQRNTR